MMARRSRTEMAILGFLTWFPMSGYDIKKAIDGSISNFWSESYGQIYPILKRLAVAGLVEPDPTKPNASKPGSGRPSQAYRLAEPGRAALAEWLGRPPEPEPLRNELLLKLFFGRSNPPGVNVRHVVRCREQAVARLEEYAAIERDLRQQHRSHPDLPYWLITLGYGKHTQRALLAWCDDTLATLGGHVSAPQTPTTPETAITPKGDL